MRVISANRNKQKKSQTRKGFVKQNNNNNSLDNNYNSRKNENIASAIRNVLKMYANSKYRKCNKNNNKNIHTVCQVIVFTMKQIHIIYLKKVNIFCFSILLYYFKNKLQIFALLVTKLLDTLYVVVLVNVVAIVVPSSSLLRMMH